MTVFPLLLAFGILTHLAVVGRAGLAILGIRCGHTRAWMLAPVFGLALVSLVAMTLNQAGWPVARFGLPLALAGTVAAIIVLIRVRIRPPRRFALFAALLAVSALIDGWPSLRFGFAWVGYGNDDMTNYCLGAQRFLEHGFYAIPTPADLAGADPAQYYWFLHVARLIRFGSELLIAYVAAASGLPPLHAFMPTLIASALIQLTALMALALGSSGQVRRALAAGAILALLPLWHCGTTYQLIAQVGGLALLAALFSLTARTRYPGTWPSRIRLALAAAVLLAALGVHYPEVLPFFVLGWGLWAAGRTWKNPRWPAAMAPTAILAILLVAVLLRQNGLSTWFTLANQLPQGFHAKAAATKGGLFPYFTSASGPAYLFGFDTFTKSWAGAGAQFAVFAGIAAAAAGLIGLAVSLRRLSLNTAVLAVMLALGLKLFCDDAGFGLFKLAMFTQPFLALAVAPTLIRHRVFAVVLALALPVWIAGVWRYTQASVPSQGNTTGEMDIASCSRGRLPTEGTPVWSATASYPVSKLLLLEAPRAHAEFLSQKMDRSLIDRPTIALPDWAWRLVPGPADARTRAELIRNLDTVIYRKAEACGQTFWERQAANAQPAPGTQLVTSTFERHSFNKLPAAASTPAPGLFACTPIETLANHLVFIPSDEGQHYYLGEAGRIAVYRPQPDIYQSDGYFFAIGRRLLFRVITPAPGPLRLRFAMTASILGAGRTPLPTDAVVRSSSTTAHPLGLVGAGSANVFSPPLELTTVDGATYLALDLNRDPIPFALPRTTAAPGAALDTRLGLGYCRDVSLVTDAEYQARSPGRAIRNFPADLLGPAAPEYSGLYEDGWTAGEAFVMLGPVAPGETVVVEGERPLLPGAPELLAAALEIDSVPVATAELAPGSFRLEHRIATRAARIRVGLRFAATTALLSPDDRPISVHIRSIQIESAP